MGKGNSFAPNAVLVVGVMPRSALGIGNFGNMIWIAIICLLVKARWVRVVIFGALIRYQCALTVG